MLRFPFTAPPLGSSIEIIPGLHWLRMALPFALDHVNLWFIASDDGVTLIDTGIKARYGLETFARLFLEKPKLKPTSLLITHGHPDHIGLAGPLAETYGLPLVMHEPEYHYVLDTQRRSSGDLAEVQAFYRRYGYSEAFAARFAPQHRGYRATTANMPPLSQNIDPTKNLSVGPYSFHVFVDHGHSPHQIALLDGTKKLCIAGDAILPGISPNISLWPSDPAANPLRAYFATLEIFAGFAEDILVLPSHGLPFYGAATRAAQIRQLHQQRLAEITLRCAQPSKTEELCQALFPTIDNEKGLADSALGHLSMFAIGETLAHVQLLTNAGVIIECEPALFRTVTGTSVVDLHTDVLSK